jgi:anti-anti-sigma factor
MKISVAPRSKALIVAVSGRMDAVSAPDFEQTMAGHIAAGTSRFVVDCQALEYVSSAGLRSFLSTAKALRTHNGELVIAGLSQAVREVFEISGFVSIFAICDSAEAALERW